MIIKVENYQSFSSEHELMTEGINELTEDLLRIKFDNSDNDNNI